MARGRRILGRRRFVDCETVAVIDRVRLTKTWRDLVGMLTAHVAEPASMAARGFQRPDQT